jgi:MoxR-like ATPase
LSAGVHDTLRQQPKALADQLGKVILGKSEVLENLTIALLSGSHILMEDVPGVGKTTLAKALARSISGDFKRVQFTPDLLPADILGSSVYSPKDGSFTFKQGPVFTNILLADEFHGTYPLPEAQLDRFGMRINIGYPSKEHELEVLFSQFHHHPLDDIAPILDGGAVLELQTALRAVRVERPLGRYLVDIADATRHHPSIKMGCSPRGVLSLFRTWPRTRNGRAMSAVPRTGAVAAAPPQADALDPRVAELLRRADALLLRSGHSRPASRAPLEHLEALPQDALQPAQREDVARAVQCFYRARYGGEQPAAPELDGLLARLPPA